MRARSPGAGNRRELAVMAVLVAEGWLCASRRHIGGAGDVLAVRSYPDLGSASGDGHDVMLIEVKSTAGGPWAHFGPADRQALVDTAIRSGAEAWLYWWPARGKLARIHASEFPPQPQPKPQTPAELFPPGIDFTKNDPARLYGDHT